MWGITGLESFYRSDFSPVSKDSLTQLLFRQNSGFFDRGTLFPWIINVFKRKRFSQYFSGNWQRISDFPKKKRKVYESVKNKIIISENEFIFRFLVQHIILWSPHGRNAKKGNLCWISRIFKLTFLQIYRVQVFDLGFSQKLCTCGEGFDCENFDFLPCIRILIVRKFKKVLYKRMYFEIETDFPP